MQQQRLQHSAEFLAPTNLYNPYPLYRELQASLPIYYDEGLQTWMVSRYHDITELLKDSRLSSGVYNAMVEQSPEQLKPYLEFLMNGIGFMDPPNHTRLRNLVHYGFAPNFITDLEERIQRITDQAVDELLAQGDAVVDLKTTFAITVPFKVLTEFLNLPYEDRDLFRRWTEGLLAGVSTGAGYEDLLTGVRTVNELRTYFIDLIEHRRKHLSNDFITLLIAAEEQGDRLNNEEMISLIMSLVVAGHETTSNLILNGVLALSRNPDQWEGLKANPELAKTAVEEILRYDAMAQALARLATEDFEYNGHQIRAGEKVTLILASGNHDPSVFEHPEQLNLARENNPHLSFGHGIHYCAGSALARMEGRIIFETIARRLPNLQVMDQELTYNPTMVVRELKQLLVRVQ